MSRRKRRTHSASFKARVAISALTEKSSIAEIAKAYDVFPAQVSNWKNTLLKHAPRAFQGGDISNHPQDLQPLLAKIGELTIKNDLLEKKLNP